MFGTEYALKSQKLKLIVVHCPSILAREITAWCPDGILRMATSDSAAIATQLPRYLTSAWDTQEQRQPTDRTPYSKIIRLFPTA
jgi:hypothetical protein